MAGASDKARYFLEQSLPELHELERKKLFTKDEVSAIAKKRSDFEHIINSRGSQPSDFARYAEYEMNLEALRKKRLKRSGSKSTTHNGQRRIFFILDRATFKFKNDFGLWMQLIEYAKKQKSYAKLENTLTTVLRLHPTKQELWIFAARHAIYSQGDITSARSYMQRGLRFCQKSKSLWLEFSRLEMLYISKIAARRHILGLDEDQGEEQLRETNDFNSDLVALPTVTAADLDPSLATAENNKMEVLVDAGANPALSGAIPLAIYDTAMERFRFDEDLAKKFFDMFADFANFPSTIKILQHVFDDLLRNHPYSLSTATCNMQLLVTGIQATSQDFPLALSKLLEQLKVYSQSHPQMKQTLEGRVALILEPFSKVVELDAGVRKALNASLKRLQGSTAP